LSYDTSEEEKIRVMADNIRASFVLVDRPSIFFNKVEGAKKYSFTLLRKEVENDAKNDTLKNSIWTKTKYISDLKSTSSNYSYEESDYLYFEYPDDESELERLTSYIIIINAETCDEIKTARGEIILFEEEVTSTFLNAYKEVQKNINQTNLVENFNRLTNSIFSSPIRKLNNNIIELSLASTGGSGGSGWGPRGCPPVLFIN
jgi:hypothetical protein